ncbi:MAG: isomerase [Bacteroidetes bacterium GWF2_33_16]|nr:MAG: isomerase [Bacteroidetes bacterium GWE2_32_14]OFY08244.1 MAG: isomerase [Bacteroidetes bacterium GWF2_33_16]
MIIKIFKLDAFTNELFSGNPAAVCILDYWLKDTIMQKIATENNLAETAFVVKNNESYEIRWFTPLVEVDLCGHATLAASFVLFKFYNEKSDKLRFKSIRSGELITFRGKDESIVLNFPIDAMVKCKIPKELEKGFQIKAKECFKGKTDFLLVFDKQEDIENLNPDLSEIRRVGGRGVIVTAPGKDYDFVSRFFAPQSGINEDPVTGSAHTTLTPYWANKLNKNELKALQLSERKGYLNCSLQGDRVFIAGNVVPYLSGEIII